MAARPYSEQPDADKPDAAFRLKNREGDTVIGRLDRLDLAGYRLNSQTRAFGIRHTAHVGYSGGGTSNQNITLFAVVSGSLKPVLNVPAYAFEDLAGNRNADGSTISKKLNTCCRFRPNRHTVFTTLFGVADARLIPNAKCSNGCPNSSNTDKLHPTPSERIKP